MESTGNKKITERLRVSFAGYSVRTRITLAILLAFVLVLPVISLSLFYLSDLLTTTQVITERDVRLGRTATDLIFTMLDIQRQERNFRVFGSSVESEAIARRIASADSMIESARRIAPESEAELLGELDQRLTNYRNSFQMLVSYLKENPPAERIQRIRSKLMQQFYEFESMFKSIQQELEKAPPAQRDSILSAANKYVDVFSIDQIVAFNGAGEDPAQTSYIQQSLDSARQEFLQTAQRFASANWENMQENKETALRIEARAKRNIIFVLILTAIACFFMIVKLPGYIVRPITSLSSMLRKVGNGDLHVYAPVTSNDEIGDLAINYNQVMERIRTYDDLKTKKIASQKRSIERLIDYLNVPICILSRNMVALYYNARFSSMFGPEVPQKIPDGGLDLTKAPELRELIETLKKKTAQSSGDFQFSLQTASGGEIILKGRPVRNAALNLESIVIIGAEDLNGKGEDQK